MGIKLPLVHDESVQLDPPAATYALLKHGRVIVPQIAVHDPQLLRGLGGDQAVLLGAETEAPLIGARYLPDSNTFEDPS